MASVIIFDGFTVRADRIVCDMRLSDARFAYTDSPAMLRAGFIEAVCRRFPQIGMHACVNDHGSCFGDCMGRTSLPHVIEHMVIALQAEAEMREAAARPMAVKPMTYVGKTSWTDKSRLTARIEVNYRDDITAFRAFRDAGLLVDSIVLK